MSEHPVDPTDAQIQAVLNFPDDGPVVMLNLNRYRDREAYLRDYGLVAFAAIQSVGGRILWQTDVQQQVIGTDDDHYDEAIAVWYPNRAAFLGLMDHPGYLEATAAREASLEKACLLALTPPPE